MIKLVFGFALCLHLTSGIAIEEPKQPSDVLDLAARVGTWFLAMGAYSGRQERPYGRPDEFGTNDDLPDVYIPNELTGSEIEKAFRLSGHKQAVIEINELLDYLSFVNGRGGPPFFRENIVEIKDGHFTLQKDIIETAKGGLQQIIELEEKDEIIELAVTIMEQLKVKTKFEDWDDMSAEANRIYQEVMGKVLEKGFLKLGDDGFYTLTKTTTEIVSQLVEENILSDEKRWRLGSEPSFQDVKEYEAFEERVMNMINSASVIVKLPQELTWSGLKSAIQAMYKKAISQIHVFQFLTKKLEYIELDKEVGISKLSPFITQAFTDNLYWMFRYMTPLRQL